MYLDGRRPLPPGPHGAAQRRAPAGPRGRLEPPHPRHPRASGPAWRDPSRPRRHDPRRRHPAPRRPIRSHLVVGGRDRAGHQPPRKRQTNTRKRRAGRRPPARPPPPAHLDVPSHDGFPLRRADLSGATLWSWDGSELVTRELGIGNHILVNGGLDDDDPLVPHFTPLLAALPDPELNGEETSTAQTWGPWIQLMAGAGLATDDSRALIVRRTIEGRTYGSTSASLVALAEGRVRYDFNPAPAEGGAWSEVVGPVGIEPTTERL